jgi:diguanylate cyclase (GGDEF)-like protein/PAS domain S-box-containing protein
MNSTDETIESERLKALHDLQLLDTPPEADFDELVYLAAQICEAPISLMSIVDADRQWFKASVGLAARETSRRVSFCTHAIQQPNLFVVEDATRDERFAGNPLVTGDPGIRFYAGMPLVLPDGHAIGTLCVVDIVPRTLTETQESALAVLARQLISRIVMRVQQRSLEAALAERDKAAVDLRASEDRFQIFMDNGPFVSYMKDAEGRMLYYNRRFAQQFCVSSAGWLGLRDDQIWPEDIARALRERDVSVLQGGLPIESTEETPGPNGQTLSWNSHKFPCRDRNGNLLLAGISVDITDDLERAKALRVALRDKSKLAEELEARKHIMQKFMEHSPNTMFVKDDCGRYVFYNAEFAKCVGIDRTEWLGRSDDEVFPKGVAERYIAEDLRVMESEQTLEFNDEVRDADGALHRFRTLKFTYKDVDGRNLLAGVTLDMTEQVNREEALEKANLQLELLATTDSLTGLFNRRVFGSRAAIEFSNAKRSRRSLSVLVMDIDDFKKRNDTYGHAAGDAALQTVGKILNGCVRMGDATARLGGEEFGVLLPDTDSSGAIDLAFRIQTALSQQAQGPAPLTVSVGASSMTEEIASWEQLLRSADDAMYEAKRSGKNRVIHHENLDANTELPPGSSAISLGYGAEATG